MFLSIPMILALLIVISVHEAAHAWMADRLGDPTAKYAGRLSLNPIKHLDLWGTLMFVFVGFGWGKPVPVNTYNFRNPVKDSALTALAGPASNILLAFLLALPIKYLPAQFGGFTSFLELLLFYNLVLAIFNLLPFPPLDGSKILGLIVPDKWHSVYARYLDGGMIYFLLFILFDMFFLSKILGNSILGTVLFTVVDFLRTQIFLTT